VSSKLANRSSWTVATPISAFSLNDPAARGLDRLSARPARSRSCV
jgi:hypothetical protein